MGLKVESGKFSETLGRLAFNKDVFSDTNIAKEKLTPVYKPNFGGTLEVHI